MDALPAEYLHEPGLALGSGEDGSTWCASCWPTPPLPRPEGLLAIEVGHNREIVEGLPDPVAYMVVGPSGDDKIFILEAGQLL